MRGETADKNTLPNGKGEDVFSFGKETTGLENLGYQRPERIEDRFGLSVALYLGRRLGFTGFFRNSLFAMKTSVQEIKFAHGIPPKVLASTILYDAKRVPALTGRGLSRNHRKNNLLGMEGDRSANKVRTSSKNAHARVSEIAPNTKARFGKKI